MHISSFHYTIVRSTTVAVNINFSNFNIETLYDFFVRSESNNTALFIHPIDDISQQWDGIAVKNATLNYTYFCQDFHIILWPLTALVDQKTVLIYIFEQFEFPIEIRLFSFLQAFHGDTGCRTPCLKSTSPSFPSHPTASAFPNMIPKTNLCTDIVVLITIALMATTISFGLRQQAFQ